MCRLVRSSFKDFKNQIVAPKLKSFWKKVAILFLSLLPVLLGNLEDRVKQKIPDPLLALPSSLSIGKYFNLDSVGTGCSALRKLAVNAFCL